MARGKRLKNLPSRTDNLEGNDMKAWVVVVVAVAVLGSAALAQTSPPPMVGDKPLVQVKPKGNKAGDKAEAAPKAAAPKGKPQSIAARLQVCLEIDDGTKNRLDCYDTVFPPKPAKGKPPAAKGVADCHVVAEQDERLACYNGFAESIPKLPKS
jgi:hypothetical protein